MEYKGKVLILDNFRNILRGYSVDIQDVVRSAILDNVDISKYIEDCSSNPFRLDQIRLGMKEGIPEGFFRLSGENIFQIRALQRKGKDISAVEKQFKSNLSNEYMKYLVKWVDSGINLSKINISIIPKQLLEVFDYGLSNGFDMSAFNTGYSYSPEYIKLCLQIMNNKNSVSFLLNGKWSINCLDVLAKHSKMSPTYWNKLSDVVDYNITVERLRYILGLITCDSVLNVIQEKDGSGEYVYSDEYLSILLDAYKRNLYSSDLLNYFDVEVLQRVISERELKKKRKISGKIIRY